MMKFILKNILFLIFIFSGVASAQKSPGTSKTHFIIDGLLGEKTVYETPYYILRTDDEYPKILIDACIHGDEVAGKYACDTVMKYIDVLEGTVVFVPMVNIQAFEKNVRGVNVDLNQVFPGDPNADLYEERLAKDFMDLVALINPDVVINLHEAWTKYDDNLYKKQKDKSFGQTIITNSEERPVFLVNTQYEINKKISDKDKIFRIQSFPYKENHSMDNIIDKLKIPSYTIETLRTLPLEERINYQVICILAFIREAGINFEYYGKIR